MKNLCFVLGLALVSLQICSAAFPGESYFYDIATKRAEATRIANRVCQQIADQCDEANPGDEFCTRIRSRISDCAAGVRTNPKCFASCTNDCKSKTGKPNEWKECTGACGLCAVIPHERLTPTEVCDWVIDVCFEILGRRSFKSLICEKLGEYFRDTCIRILSNAVGCIGTCALRCWDFAQSMDAAKAVSCATACFKDCTPKPKRLELLREWNAIDDGVLIKRRVERDIKH
eukprot:TRINITY_DN2959_c0_g1_i1.p1 TRINITY_DN2959_c0_g1~~TRINITY_DN2959_c0_g1_i1.p1  ORF type:complete len:231 (-),score=49.33 TRINITY_DN2959_c0_g1_i1:184-876(-)